MKLTSRRCGLIAGAMLVMAAYSNANAQQAFLYQGRLLDAGTPVVGPVNLTFKMFDAAVAGVQVGGDLDFFGFADFGDDGTFTVELDFGAGTFNGAARWLEIWVAGAPLDPRQEIASSPYAHHATTAAMVVDGGLPGTYASMIDFTNAANTYSGSFGGNGAALVGLNASALASGTVGSGRLSGTYSNAMNFSNAGNTFLGDGSGLTGIDWNGLGNVPAGFADGIDNTVWTPNGSNAYLLNGNVGIGTTVPFNAVHVLRNLADPAIPLVRVHNTADSSSAIALSTNFQTWRIGQNRPPDDSTQVDAFFIYDDTAAETRLFIETNGNVGIGTTTPTSRVQIETGGATAVLAETTAPSGTAYGVSGNTASTAGRALHGHASATSGTTFGVYAQNDSSNGRGVYGNATASGGANYGVYGNTNSTSGRAIYGTAGASSGLTYGVYGWNNSTSGRGVYGYATANSGGNFGVYGESDSSTGFGVYGLGGDYAVFAEGDSGASGTKSFVIDHPLDPENKYLKHYSAEGPEPQNIYNGVAMLDSMGEAWIDLPEYFEAINRDPRYTLTPIGAAMPNLHVAEKVFDNTFRISGGVPGMEVSWEVKAVRDDAYMRARGAAVEVNKPEHERGLYRHPELYGQPAEKAIHRSDKVHPADAE